MRQRGSSRKRAAVAAAVVGFSVTATSLARGATSSWTNPFGGTYSDAANWNGGAGPVPGSTDNPRFDLSAPYTVSFTTSPVTASAEVFAGNVTWVAGGAARAYGFASGDSLFVRGGTLTLGAAGAPTFTVNAAAPSVLAGATMNVTGGSVVTGSTGVYAAGATAGVTQPAIINVTGAGSSVGGGGLQVGGSASDDVGQVTYAADSSGAFSGTVNVQNGTLLVQDDAGVTAARLLVGTTGVAATAGAVTVSGAGSTLASTGSVTNNIYNGSLHIADGATFTSPLAQFVVRSAGVFDFTGGNVAFGKTVTVQGLLRGSTATGTLQLLGSARLRADQGGVVEIDGPIDLTGQPFTSAGFEAAGAGSRFTTTGSLRLENAVATGNSGGRLEAASVELRRGGSVSLGGAGTALTTGATTIGAEGGGNALGSLSVFGTAAAIVSGAFDLRANGKVELFHGGHLTVSGPVMIGGAPEAAPQFVVRDAGSTFTQTGSEPVTIGSPGGATRGLLQVLNGGRVYTGSGLLTVHPGSTIETDYSGALEHAGDILVDGANVALTNWADGRAMTIRNDAHVQTLELSLDGNSIDVEGDSNAFVSVRATLNSGSTLRVNGVSSAQISALNLATDGTTASVSIAPTAGAGVLFAGRYPSAPNVWGADGGNATVTVGSGGWVQSDGDVKLASTGEGTTGTILIQGGGMTSRAIWMQDNTSGSAAATLTVDGTNSSFHLTSSPSAVGGAAGTGAATINVLNGADFFMTAPATSLVLHPTATMNITGGDVRTESLAVAGGKVNFNAGTFTVGAKFSVTSGGQVDVNDNAFVVRAGGNYAVGSLVGSTYTGVSGMIASGRNGGTWDGAGVITSEADAIDGLTSIGIARADALGLVGSVYAGITLGETDVIVAYTYAGDANLDGIISGDDYSAIDFASGVAGAYGWSNGDFNYDGVISGDDYSIIDFNLVAQGAPIIHGGPGAADVATAVSVVPEPGTGGLGLAVASLLLRRRRRKTA